MALSQRSTLLLFVVAAVCIQLYQAQGFFGRCTCLSTIKLNKLNISDFDVFEKRPGCDKTELIVTVTGPNNATERACIDTQEDFTKAFLKCWERINKNESRKMECIDRKNKAERKFKRRGGLAGEGSSPGPSP
ncbi:chemokine (C-X-C motif) ligand 18b [Paralichthys olivaceus]|uniref:chemokine (C-X-C motif) ligand 18b n=1 Tax=Paralichthys olivaceus TaxID=8255 RepID=UPI003750276A